MGGGIYALAAARESPDQGWRLGRLRHAHVRLVGPLLPLGTTV